MAIQETTSLETKSPKQTEILSIGRVENHIAEIDYIILTLSDLKEEKKNVKYEFVTTSGLDRILELIASEEGGDQKIVRYRNELLEVNRLLRETESTVRPLNIKEHQIRALPKSKLQVFAFVETSMTMDSGGDSYPYVKIHKVGTIFEMWGFIVHNWEKLMGYNSFFITPEKMISDLKISDLKISDLKIEELGLGEGLERERKCVVDLHNGYIGYPDSVTYEIRPVELPAELAFFHKRYVIYILDYAVNTIKYMVHLEDIHGLTSESNNPAYSVYDVDSDVSIC